jgi:hypothetical protein
VQNLAALHICAQIAAVSAHRTAWHFFFTILLRQRGPRWIEVRDEVPLSEEPPRLDYLLLRKLIDPPVDDPGQTLRGLWARLPLITVAELKSVGRPYRAGDLDRLWSYVHMYWAGPRSGLEHRGELGALLLVPARTSALDADRGAMGLVWNDLGGGYWRVTGGLFPLHIVEIDVVAEREDDDLLRLFSHSKEQTLEARRFWAEQVGTKEAMMAVQDLEGYDEVVEKFLELIPPERRLAGLAPEQRLAGLSREQMLLALPDEVLRSLSEDYLSTFPEPTRLAVRKRLGQ